MVVTTCARDYVTWRNEWPAGVEPINGVPVRRFPVRRERDHALPAADAQPRRRGLERHRASEALDVAHGVVRRQVRAHAAAAERAAVHEPVDRDRDRQSRARPAPHVYLAVLALEEGFELGGCHHAAAFCRSRIAEIESSVQVAKKPPTTSTISSIDSAR